MSFKTNFLWRLYVWSALQGSPGANFPNPSTNPSLISQQTLK